MINPEKAVKWYKERFNTLGQTDYDVYQHIQRVYKKDKDGNDISYGENPFTTSDPKQSQIPTQQELDEKANPGFFEKILTANLSEAWAEDGNWWGEAYNKSIAGTIYQIMHGEAKYKEEDVDRAWYDEAGQFFVGLVSPVDMLTFFGSSGVGSVAAKSITHGPLKNMATKGFSQMLAKAGANRSTRKAMAGGFHNYLARGAGIESGFSLATYGAAGGALQDAAQQSIEIKDGLRDEMDYKQMTWNATKHGASSLALGAAAGYFTKGLMAPKFAKARMATDKTFANKVTQLTMNPVGQVIAEGTLFGTGQIAERALMGEEVDMDDWLSSIFMNTAIVGGLRASMKPLRMGEGDVERYRKAKHAFYGDIFEKAGFKTKSDPKGKVHDLLGVGEKGEMQSRYEKIERIESDLIEAGVPIPSELVQEKINIISEARDAYIGIPAYNKALKKYTQNLDKMDDIPKLSSRKERHAARAELLKEFGFINNTLYGITREMSKNKEKFFTKEEMSTEAKIKDIDAELNKKIKSLEDVHDMVNLGALNEPGIAKKMRTKYADSFDVSVKEVKNKDGEIIGYEPVLTTPKGNELVTGARRDSYNEALALGEGLKKTYKQELLKQRDPLKREVKEKDIEEVEVEGAPEFETTGYEYDIVPSEPTKTKKTITKETKTPKTLDEQMEFLVQSELERKEKEFEVQAISAKIPMSRKNLNDKISERDKLTVIKRGDKKPYDWKKQLKNETKDMRLEEVKLVEMINAKDKTGELSRAAIERGDFDSSAFIDYAKARLSGDIGRSKTDFATGVIKNPKNGIIEVSRFLNEYKGKDLTEVKISDLNKFFNDNILGRKDGNTTSNKPSNELNLFFKHLGINEFLRGPDSNRLMEYARTVMNEYNEWNASGAGKNPAKKGIRKFTIEEAIASGDKGVEIVGKLGARYYIRNLEINKLAEILKDNPKDLEKYLKFEDKTKEYFLDMDANFVKYNTFNRKVWIDKKLAEDIMQYVGSGKSLMGKAAKVGQLINKKKMSDNPNSAFYDLRRRGKSIGAKLGGKESATENYLFGHERTRIDRVYNIKEASDLIIAQKELHKKMGSPIDVKFKKGDVSKGPFKQGFDPARERFVERWAAKDKLSPEQLQQAKLGKGVLGQFIDAAEGAILLAKDRFQPTDYFHEKFHKLKAYARETNDVKLSKDLSILEQLASKTSEYKEWKSKKQNKNRDMEEFTADVTGDKAQALTFPPSLFSRFNQALKQVVSRVKTILGIGNFNDYANIVSKRLTQKLDTRGVQFKGGVTKYKKISDASFESPSAYKNFLNKQVRDVEKKYNVNRNEFIEFIAKRAGIDNPKNFRLTIPKDQNSIKYSEKINELNKFVNKFDEVLSGELKDFIGKKDALKKLNLISDIERNRLPRNITLADQVKTLKALDVKDGKLFNATVKELKEYNDFVINQDIVQRDGVGWMSLNDVNNLRRAEVDSGMQSGLKEGAMILGSTHAAVKKIGMSDIAEKLLTHNSIQATNESPLLKFNEGASKIIGGNFLTRETKLSKIKNNMVVALDNNGEMLLALQKAKKEYGNKLPKGEGKIIKNAQSFFDKVINPEWSKTIKTGRDGRTRGDGLAAKNKDGSYKYINLNTKEGQIAKLYIDTIQKGFGKDKFESSLRQNTNQAEFESMSSKSGIKFIEDGIYITRSLTQEGKRLLYVNERARANAVNKLATDIAYKRAKDKYGKDFTKEQLSKEMEDSRLIAEMQFDDMINFNPSKISIKYLKDRLSLQDLYIENEKGKLVRTYENSFDKTVTPYVQGMAKFYATLEMFPEAIQGMKPGNGIHKVFQGAEGILKGGKQKELNWVKEVINKQLGAEKSADPYELSYRTLESTARIVAKLGLSFPTAGFKNLITGTTQTVFAHRLRDVGEGFALVLAKDAEVYNRAMNSNAFTVGNVLYEGRHAIDKVLDATAFKAGFMRPTEKFNRLLAIASSIAEQRRLLERIALHPKESNLHQKAVRRLKSFYFLNDKEIALRIKYGNAKEVRADNTLSNYEKIQLMRDVENINNKMNTYAHINTQGSSADLFMPKWAGKEGLRPLTLFKRMAFAATENTIRNTKEAVQNKNFMKPIMGLTATYLSGSAMIGLYRHLLGTEMPKENTDWWTRFRTTMWKGEFLGIMSEAISPFDTGFTQTLEPAIFNTIGSIGMELGQLYEGKSNFNQFGDGVFRNTTSLYANIQKIRERTNNPLNRDRIRISKLYRDFMDEKGQSMPKDMEGNELSPYYEDFKNSFYLGDEEDFAKQFYSTFFAVAHDRYRTGDPMNIAFKKAFSIMKSKLKTLNPNKGSLFKSGKEGKRNSMKFIKWLQQHRDADKITMTLFEAEAQYKARLNDYTSKLKHYAKKFNVQNYYNDFNWDIKEGF